MNIYIEFQVRGSIDRTFDFREIIFINNMKQMLCIGTKRLNRDVIESFIKYTMYSNFTSLRFDIIPDDILCDVRDITKEDSFSRFIFEPLCLDSWSTDPNSTSKST